MAASASGSSALQSSQMRAHTLNKCHLLCFEVANNNDARSYSLKGMLGPCRAAAKKERSGSFRKLSGPSTDPQIVPQSPFKEPYKSLFKGPSIYRNSHRLLIRINSKSAFYQPQTPLKKP